VLAGYSTKSYVTEVSSIKDTASGETSSALSITTASPVTISAGKCANEKFERHAAIGDRQFQIHLKAG
jgi:hypothetical protein